MRGLNTPSVATDNWLCHMRKVPLPPWLVQVAFLPDLLTYIGELKVREVAGFTPLIVKGLGERVRMCGPFCI